MWITWHILAYSMKTRLSLGAFILSIGLLQAQSLKQLPVYLSTAGVSNQERFKSEVSEFISKLKSKSRNSDKQFLRTVFNLTHRQFLKEYKQYAGFNELFEDGKYDCLTATSFYSVLLTELGYEHTIMETAYHVFLLVESDQGQVLMESTDPIGGFEYLQENIDQRIASYRAQEQLELGDLANRYGSVSRLQLVGLLYYNQCVMLFNNQQWTQAHQMLSQAKAYYNSPRIIDMENIILNALATSELNKQSEVGQSERRISMRQE